MYCLQLKLLIIIINNLCKDQKDVITIGLDFVEKREIDRSTLHIFDGPLQLLHADIGNLEFLGKSADHPKFCLLFVDLYSSKI